MHTVRTLFAPIWMTRAENVPHVRARNELECAAALPRSKADLEIFAAPNVHARVVATDFPEV